MELNYNSLKQTILDLKNGARYLKDFSTIAIKEIQFILNSRNYYKGKIDGLYGPQTAKGFAIFKKDRYLAYPELIGFSTIKALAEASILNKITPKIESVPFIEPKVNLAAGSKTGASMLLPTGERVYSNQFMIEGIPLTWGEFTKNCTRQIPDLYILRNAYLTAKNFGKIRSIANCPIAITSGYRPPHLKIGAKYSQHKLALALDMYPLDKNLNRLWHIFIKSNIVGCGDARRLNFLHADWRESGNRVVFYY